MAPTQDEANPLVKEAATDRRSKREDLNDLKNKLLTFEQMGVDDLTVDEAHEFKNLYYSSLCGVAVWATRPVHAKQTTYNKVRAQYNKSFSNIPDRYANQ